MSARWPALCIGFFIFGYIDSGIGLNCRDGSTETVNRCQALLNAQEPSVSQGCILPNITHSRLVYETDQALTQGGTVPHLSLIVYQCETGYLRVGPQFNLCDNGNWHSKTHATCIRPCSNDMLRGITFTAACERDGLTVPCDDPILPGTVARLNCKKHYKKRIPYPDALVCQDDGTWDKQIKVVRCDLKCGDLVTRDTPFITNGELTTITFVPWHVAIYKKESDGHRYHCGGTILSENLIVSAATCFMDRHSNVTYDKSLFTIGAGKHLGHYEANDPKAQLRTVDLIAIPNEFTFDGLNDDIALLVLESPLYFTYLISPVCIDWKYDYDRHIDVNVQGYVVNYGRKDENGDFTRDTRITKMMTSNCTNFENKKFCATDRCLRNTCQDLIGSGFTVEKLVNGKNKHHLWGIASVRNTNLSLRSFTNALYQEAFIMRYLLDYMLN